MGPCTVNARWPTVDSRCRGTTIICCVADPRRCLYAVTMVLTFMLKHIETAHVYGIGSVRRSHLYFTKPTLKPFYFAAVFFLTTKR